MINQSIVNEKLVWTEEDFTSMQWHDTTIHAIAFDPENYQLLFDIDYILQWVNPISPNNSYKFWVAPATLIFVNVSNIQFKLDTQIGEFSLQDISRTDEEITPNKKFVSWLWTLDGHEGTITFRATGFKQILRRKPILSNAQFFTLSERGGVSFKQSFD